MINVCECGVYEYFVWVWFGMGNFFNCKWLFDFFENGGFYVVFFDYLFFGCFWECGIKVI